MRRPCIPWPPIGSGPFAETSALYLREHRLASPPSVSGLTPRPEEPCFDEAGGRLTGDASGRRPAGSGEIPLAWRATVHPTRSGRSFPRLVTDGRTATHQQHPGPGWTWARGPMFHDVGLTAAWAGRMLSIWENKTRSLAGRLCRSMRPGSAMASGRSGQLRRPAGVAIRPGSMFSTGWNATAGMPRSTISCGACAVTAAVSPAGSG
jgi:hypothetical protein